MDLTSLADVVMPALIAAQSGAASAITENAAKLGKTTVNKRSFRVFRG